MESAPLKLLLVEDHEDTASMVRLLLTREGYDVTVVGSCADAIIRARHSRFDVLLSDIGLPDGDGYALLKSLRQLYPITAVALTGFAYDRDKDRATQVGFEYFITKPYDFQTVAGILETIAHQMHVEQGMAYHAVDWG